MARDFYGLLFGSRDGDPCVEVASPLTERRLAEARAFAAELLAPADTIRARLSGEKFVSSDEVQAIADELCVHVDVIRHQVEDRGIAGIVSDADR